MIDYPEYPTTEDAWLRENAEKVGLRSYKMAKEVATFVREIVIWQESGSKKPVDPQIRFFISELRRNGLDITLAKNKHWS